MIGFLIGRILLTEAALLALPTVTAILYGESPMPFLTTALALAAVGLLLGSRKPRQSAIYARDGFAVVALAWILMSAFGALPFVLSGDIPSYVDALFETVSGFTTTGATILPEVESLSRGILFWRSFTHWVGGMGVLVFVMAILPMSDGHGMHLMRAEVPGPSVGKLVSRMSDSAKILYGIYLVMTLLEIFLLLAGGMPLFDACIHSFGSAGTGGFSNRNLSVGAYGNAYYELVIGVFMLLFGINFNLYFLLLMRDFKQVLKSEELRVYLGVALTAMLLIALNILPQYGGFGVAFRYSAFQVSSIMTTTGFATADYTLWPTFSQTILFLLMILGACGGSTGGGLKVSRAIILVKSLGREVVRLVHPRAVSTVRLDGKRVEAQTVRDVGVFFIAYMFIIAVMTLLISLDGFGFATTFSAVTACMGNIGPGLGAVGPMGNFADFSLASKLLLSLTMLLGRLEIFPLVLFFTPVLYEKR